MTKNGKIFRPNYNHSESDKLAIKTVKAYYNIIEQLQNGQAPDKEAAEIIIQTFEQLAVEMSRIHKVQIEILPFTTVPPYYREQGNYVSKAFEPLFKLKKSKKQKILKKEEIVTVLMLFHCYLYYIYNEDADKASELRTQFIIDFPSWYRDSDGNSIGKSSIYDYKKLNTFGINLVKKEFSEEDLIKEIILSENILKAFFINNNVNDFPNKYSGLKKNVIDFHAYIQQVLAD